MLTFLSGTLIVMPSLEVIHVSNLRAGISYKQCLCNKNETSRRKLWYRYNNRAISFISSKQVQFRFKSALNIPYKKLGVFHTVWDDHNDPVSQLEHLSQKSEANRSIKTTRSFYNVNTALRTYWNVRRDLTLLLNSSCFNMQRFNQVRTYLYENSK